MKTKKLFKVVALIVEKDKEFELPKNTVKSRIFLTQNELNNDNVYNDYMKVNFKTHKLMIVFVDENRVRDNADLLFKIIKDNFSVTEKQIKSRSRDSYVVWSRHLFHYGFCKLKFGTYQMAGNRTNRDHSTVINSFKSITKNIKHENGWRKKQYNVFEKQINKIKNNSCL